MLKADIVCAIPAPNIFGFLVSDSQDQQTKAGLVSIPGLVCSNSMALGMSYLCNPILLVCLRGIFVVFSQILSCIFGPRWSVLACLFFIPVGDWTNMKGRDFLLKFEGWNSFSVIDGEIRFWCWTRRMNKQSLRNIHQSEQRCDVSLFFESNRGTALCQR